MSEPLLVTASALQQAVRIVKAVYPSEGCGFLLGAGGVAREAHAMINIHPSQSTQYRMDDVAVAEVYKNADVTGNEPLAVFHSHPHTGPVLSGTDIDEARNLNLAYMVISLANGVPKARAYRIEMPFVGQKDVKQIAIQTAQEEGEDPGETRMWALTPGNHVRIRYLKPGRSDPYVVNGVILAVGDETVRLKPDKGQPSPPNLLAVEKIKTIQVLREHADGAQVRREMRLHAQHLVAAMGDTLTATDIPALLRILTKAYPMDVRIEPPVAKKEDA